MDSGRKAGPALLKVSIERCDRIDDSEILTPPSLSAIFHRQSSFEILYSDLEVLSFSRFQGFPLSLVIRLLEGIVSPLRGQFLQPLVQGLD